MQDKCRISALDGFICAFVQQPGTFANGFWAEKWLDAMQWYVLVCVCGTLKWNVDDIDK